MRRGPGRGVGMKIDHILGSPKGDGDMLRSNRKPESVLMELLSVLKSDFFIMLQLYVDESGTHHPKGQRPGSEVPVVAGFMGWKNDWKKFAKDWQAVLDNYKVGYFHAKEFERGKEPCYASWSEEKHEAFRYALAEIAGRFIPVGGSYHIKEHDRTNPHDQDYPYRFPIAYFFKDLTDSMREWGFSSERISIIFDSTTNKAWMAEIATQVEILKSSGLKN